VLAVLGQPPVRTAERLGLFEEILAATEQHANPFNLLCRVEITGPENSTRTLMNVSAFYDGFAKDAELTPASSFDASTAASCSRENLCWYGGGDVTTTESGFQACCDLCTSDPKCKAFAMSNSNDTSKHCHRSYSVPAKVASNTHDCGLPNRAPTPPTPAPPTPPPTPPAPSGTVWRFRFSPDVVGTWKWATHCPEDAGLDAKSGSVEVVESANQGGVVVHPKHPQQYIREDGSPYTLIGLETDWVWALELEDETMEPPLADFVKHVSSFGFNHFMISFYANFSSWNAALPDRKAPKVSLILCSHCAHTVLILCCSKFSQCRQCSRSIHCLTYFDLLWTLCALGSHPPSSIRWIASTIIYPLDPIHHHVSVGSTYKVSPTKNTPWDDAHPDQSRLNLHYYQHWDKVLDALGMHGVIAHTMMYVGNKNVMYPPRDRYCPTVLPHCIDPL
jgi:hypothetical protein